MFPIQCYCTIIYVSVTRKMNDLEQLKPNCLELFQYNHCVNSCFIDKKNSFMPLDQNHNAAVLYFVLQ